jgi:hypothetical protein
MKKKAKQLNHFDLLHGTEKKAHALVPCGFRKDGTGVRLEDRLLCDIVRHDPPIKTWVLVYRHRGSTGTLEQRDTYLTCQIDRGDPGRVHSMIETADGAVRWNGDCGYYITPRYADPELTDGERVMYHEARRRFGDGSIKLDGE